MSGKGDTPRPVSVDRQTYDDNWARTFSRRERCWTCGRDVKQAHQHVHFCTTGCAEHWERMRDND